MPTEPSLTFEPALKPLYASLKRLKIGEYLYTKDFSLFALESRIDDLWNMCTREVSRKRRVYMPGFHNTEDEEEAFMYLMSLWYSKRPDTFHNLILPVLENFANWSLAKVDYKVVLARLDELNINSELLASFVAIYDSIQTGKPDKVEEVHAEQTSIPSVTQQNTKVKKIFISHASKDVKFVEELIDLLKLIGLQKSQIFCTSIRGYGIPLGADFLAEIKERISDEVLVLFVFSPNFYASPICLAELGAAWVLSKNHIPIVVPPFRFEDIKGVLPHTQGMMINDGLQINELAKQLSALFELHDTSKEEDWERSRDRIIERINNTLGDALKEDL